MTQREVNAMDRWERRLALADAVREVNSALNLFGYDQAPLDRLSSPTDEDDVAQCVAELLKPEPHFSKSFLRRAAPSIRAAARLAKQVLRAQ